MTDSEIREWLSMLSMETAQQLVFVQGLLRHADKDQMSVEDRITCVRALTLLGG